MNHIIAGGSPEHIGRQTGTFLHQNNIPFPLVPISQQGMPLRKPVPKF